MSEDRRHQDAAPTDPTRRRTDPTLTPADCAQLLGVSTRFVTGEIREGRLIAATNLHRDGMRGIYRVSEADLEAYKARFHWRTTSAAATEETDETDGTNGTNGTEEPAD